MDRGRGTPPSLSLMLILLMMACAPEGTRISEEAAADSAPDRDPRRGGTLVLSVPEIGSITSLDPAEASDIHASSVAQAMYEGLLGYDPETLHRFSHLLARSWEISPERTTWTFRLRSGVRFHEDPCFPGGHGREVTATDVKYSMRRVLRNGTGTSLQALRDLVIGADDYARGEAEDVEGIEIPDERTVRFRLVSPSNAFPHLLATSAGWVVPREAIEQYGDGFDRHPVGTGPFRLAAWSSGRIVLVRNEGYWATDEAGEPLPYLDTIEMRSYRMSVDRSAELTDLLGGELHLLYYTGELQLLNFERLAELMLSRGIRVVETPKWNTIYFGWNLARDNAWTRDPLLRRAVAAAVVRPEASELLEPAVGLVPAGLAGCPVDREPPRPDPEAARRLMAAAGHPGGRGLPPLEIGLLSESGVIKNSLLDPIESLGIDTSLTARTWRLHWDAVNRGDYSFFRDGWIADYPDAENFLFLFYSRSPVNHMNYSNTEYDRLYERYESLPPGDPDRPSLCAAMEKILQEDVPAIFLYHEKSYYLVRPEARQIEYSINPMEQKFYERVWLDEQS